ncbi:serine hydrolase [Rothia sp. P7181]|uniref:serine hydrolase n=1 Tax=unclassified Rothia (in: high G+C Gram-positive bacteria) TaxID=2689056 RepID=UPI003AC212B7
MSRAIISRRSALTLCGLGGLGLALNACGSSSDQGNDEDHVAVELLDRQNNPLKVSGAYRQLADSLRGLPEFSSPRNFSLALHRYDTQETFYYNPSYRGYEASTVKVPIALARMRIAYEHGKSLGRHTVSLVKSSIGYSDNNSTVLLYAGLGDNEQERSEQLNLTYQKLGVSQTRDGGGWGNNLTTAGDHLKIARAVYEGLDWVASSDMRVLRAAMEGADPSSQGWGVGALTQNPGAQRVLCKNGWIADDAGIWFINSTGDVLHHGKTYALSVMTTGFAEQQQGQEANSKVAQTALSVLSS